MAWLKLDDQFFRNPKVIDAGRDARDLYLAGLCYCGAGLTDGRIPSGALRMLGAEADIDDVRAASDALVRVGLWERRDDGYIVHDYLEYNPSKERVLATRTVRSEAGSRGGKQRASNLLEPEQAFATENLQAKSNPVPVPYPSRPTPDPEPVAQDTNDAPAARASAIDAQFESEFWAIWPKGRGSKKVALDRWRDMKPDERSACIAALPAFVSCWAWRKDGGRYVKHAERWLRDKGWKDDVPPDLEPRGVPNGTAPRRYGANDFVALLDMEDG